MKRGQKLKTEHTNCINRYETFRVVGRWGDTVEIRPALKWVGIGTLHTFSSDSVIGKSMEVQRGVR